MGAKAEGSSQEEEKVERSGDEEEAETVVGSPTQREAASSIDAAEVGPPTPGGGSSTQGVGEPAQEPAPTVAPPTPTVGPPTQEPAQAVEGDIGPVQLYKAMNTSAHGQERLKTQSMGQALVANVGPPTPAVGEADVGLALVAHVGPPTPAVGEAGDVQAIVAQDMHAQCKICLLFRSITVMKMKSEKYCCRQCALVDTAVSRVVGSVKWLRDGPGDVQAECYRSCHGLAAQNIGIKCERKVTAKKTHEKSYTAGGRVAASECLVSARFRC